MARKKKSKMRHLKRKGKMKAGHIMPLAIGAIVGNIANNLVIKYAGNVIPMAQTLSPLAIGLLANYMKSDYSNGIIAASAVNLLSGIGKQYLPENFRELVAGEDQYVIQGSESSDPLLGANYLYGEGITDELGADEFVVSGASNDPLD
jgi:hypothetical protein